MRKGFVFNSGKCVNCNSCVAACLLYNGWHTSPRIIYTYNEEMIPDLPLVNISLACNHCEDPACREVCPSGAISVFKEGVVVLDENICLGCRYCQWNCPYEAPKYSSLKRVMVKCNLCLNSAFSPACANACPTGALSYKDLKNPDNNVPDWFPGNRLKPAFEFSSPPAAASPVQIIPPRFSNVKPADNQQGRSSEDWSLIVFTLGTMLSVALLVSALMQGKFPPVVFTLLLIGSAIISFFHLGKPLRAWRAVKNILKSPLSREILFFILFSALSLFSILITSPGMLLVSGITGVMLLVTIDLVYIKADRRSLLHSGQVFLGSLMMVSWLSGSILPFLFISIIRIGLSTRKLFNVNQQQLRFLRISILVLAATGLMTGYLEISLTATIIILIGELTDRILFYIDFRPENIRLSLNPKHKV